MTLRTCRNPKCEEWVGLGRLGVCPACRQFGAWAFGLGSFVGGVLWSIAVHYLRS
jgi:hypothetical protein